MREFQQKHKIRKRVYSKTAVSILFIVTILFAKGVYGIYEKETGSRAEVDRLVKEKAITQERLAFVSKSADALATNQGIESEIRNKFDVVKPGEQVIVVVDKEIPPAPEEKKNFLEKFWGSVTGVFKKTDKATTSEQGPIPDTKAGSSE